MKKNHSLTLALALLGSATQFASAALIQDGNFTSWSSTYITNGGGSHTATVEATGGNPGARYLSDINDSDGSIVRTANIKLDYTNNSAVSGDSWTLTVDGLQGPSGTTGSQNIGLIVKQGSSIWYSVDTPAITGPEWGSYSVSSSFIPGNFQLFSGSGSPDFSGATATQFGLYTHQQQGNTEYANYYDNWTLDSTHLDPQAVPEPSHALIGLACAGAALARRRRRGNGIVA